MAKALKIFVILLLLCNIAALVLGIMLFQQRETLKGRTQKLEAAAANVARAIRHDEFQAEQIKQYASMDVPLRTLSGKAEVMYDDLQNTKQDLENTRQDLAQTKAELATTKADLAARIDEIAALNERLTQKETELAQAVTRIDDLERQTTSLKEEVDGLNTQLSEAEEKLTDCEADYASLKQDYEKILGELTGGSSAKKGLAGNILFVNPAWNFVVLDIGSSKGLLPSNEMLVHRADKLIGRVRVNTVNDQMAVAEIVQDWQALPLRKGDHVISPES